MEAYASKQNRISALRHSQIVQLLLLRRGGRERGRPAGVSVTERQEQREIHMVLALCSITTGVGEKEREA
jgi:hypothetical protein